MQFKYLDFSMIDVGFVFVFKVNLYNHLDQRCMVIFCFHDVTSRSGALTKLILWGHLLASDLDFYDDEPLNLDDDAS
jgi:hypothetical protein